MEQTGDAKSTTAALPPSPGSYPWLVYSRHCPDNGHERQTFCSIIPGSSPPAIATTHQTEIPAMQEKIVLSCSYGWLILYDADENLLTLCNCTTFNTINLPILEQVDDQGIAGCVLSSSPNSPEDCQVLLFLDDISSVFLCGLGDSDEWREIRYGEQIEGMVPYRLFEDNEGRNLFFCNPVICGGRIYAQLCDGGRSWYPHLWVIDLVGDEDAAYTMVDSLPDWNHCHSSSIRRYVVESRGEIYIVQLICGGIKQRDLLVVEVRKLNFDTMLWERVTSIKNQSFFICMEYEFSCPAPSGCEGRIYYTWSSCRGDESKLLYCYNVEDESLVVSVPCPDAPPPCSQPMWIMPDTLTRPENLREVVDKTALDVQEVLAPSTNWMHSLFGSKTNLPFPLLMFSEIDKSLYKFVDPELGSTQSYPMRIPDALEDTTVRYSSHGWLLMTRRYSVKLFNPFTGDIISCPEDVEAHKGYFFKPSGSDFLLIGITCDYGNQIEISALRPGESEWESISLTSNKRFDKATERSPVFYQDALYYLDKHANLGRLKLEGENFSWEVMDQPLSPCDGFHHNFLVECGGDLLAVFLGSRGKWVLVYKLNQSEGAWEPVSSLSNYTLYLSRSSSFSMAASPGAENRIYFPRFRGTGMVYYSLDTGRWHSSESPQDSWCDFDGTKLQLNSCWSQPTSSS